MTARTTSVDMSLEESENEKKWYPKRKWSQSCVSKSVAMQLLLAGVHNLDDLFDD
jgi:hypothetical protein